MTVRFLYLLAGAFAALLLISPVSAQTPHAATYTTRDGLAGDFVTALAFQVNGSAWVGTTRGVTHIGDAGWVSYTRAHGLGDSWITSIAVAPDGRIWFGTQSGGIAAFDPFTRALDAFTTDNSELPGNFITALVVDGKNAVWVGTLSDGLARFEVSTSRWTHYDQLDAHITALAVDDSDNMWVGTAQGLVHENGGTWTRDEQFGAVMVRRLERDRQRLTVETDEGRFARFNGQWAADDSDDRWERAARAAGLDRGQVTALGTDAQGGTWIGTASGLIIQGNGKLPSPPAPLPVVLVHGWTVSPTDTLEDSEFRFLAQYAARDGIRMFYAKGIGPHNSLFENAAVLQGEIARVKQATGAPRVNVVAFSMGGMNTRAYLESSLYAGDVNRAIILGTPQAGVELWKPILAQDILSRHDEPSTLELSPEYAELVDATRAPNPNVPYDLLIGDAREQAFLDFTRNMPANDALITVASALALDAPNVRKHVNADVHDWSPQPVPFKLTSYLYPRDTYERYLRNALRNEGNEPLGSEVESSTSPPNGEAAVARNHTPVVTAGIRAGDTVTRTVSIDENRSARFIAYYPGGTIDFSLVAPDGKRYAPSDLPTEDEPGVLTLKTDLASFSGYNIDTAAAGQWQLVLTRTDRGGAPVDVTTYVDLDAARHIEPSPLPAFAGGAPLSGTTIELRAPPGARSVTAQLAVPSREPGGAFTTNEFALFDDGQHDDRRANDGYFANRFTPPYGGWYVVRFQARGSDWQRETEAVWAVNPQSARLSSAVSIRAGSGRVTIDVGVNAGRAGQFAISAQLMGEGDLRTLWKVAPVTLQPGMNSVPISIDAPGLPPGTYSLKLKLLDANWAALLTDQRELQLTVP